MFYPNCGKENESEQKFCRSCGLQLDAVSKVVVDLLPSASNAALQRRRRSFERMGIASLSVAGPIALMSVIFAAALFKLIVFGPELLFWATGIALMVFVFLGVGLTAYAKFLLPHHSVDRDGDHHDPQTQTTGRLIDDRPFEPIPSVTENTTDLLHQRGSKGVTRPVNSSHVMAYALSFWVLMLSGVYLVALAAVSLINPAKAERFLIGFAGSASKHYVELAIRLMVGGAMLIQAPYLNFSGVFKFLGLILIATTACLLLVPWTWHRRFAESRAYRPWIPTNCRSRIVCVRWRSDSLSYLQLCEMTDATLQPR